MAKYVSVLFGKDAKKPRLIRIFFRKVLRNWIWHLTPTEVQVQRIQKLCEQYSIKFMSFVVANLIERSPNRLDTFKNHDVAPHSYNHLGYSKMTFDQAVVDMKKSIAIFEQHHDQVKIFRAPYSAPVLSDGQSWYSALATTGLKYSSSPIVRIAEPPSKKDANIIDIPILWPTDDSVIDMRNITDPALVFKEFYRKIIQTRIHASKAKKRGHKNIGTIIVFCLHPLRMGQRKYIGAVETLLHAVDRAPDFELSSFFDAVEIWESGHLKDRNLVVLSGDVDCWTFSDYIRRLKYN